MKNKMFVTIFPESQDFHLLKDVGQLPYHIYLESGYDATLVTRKNEQKYNNLSIVTPGLKIDFTRSLGIIKWVDVGVLKYIFNESKKIDVLNLIHFRYETFFYALLYKALNPSGILYIKLDRDAEELFRHGSFFVTNNKFKKIIQNIVQELLIYKSDFISIESEFFLTDIVSKIPSLNNKLLFIPNGADHNFIANTIKRKLFHEKENLIITVGRIGSDEKNNMMLLNSLNGIELNDWKVAFIGPYTDSFKNKYEIFIKDNPQLNNKVELIGNIANRLELFDWYNRAKVFCLTSNIEGMPLVIPEALYFGNYIISTDFASAYDFTRDGSGCLVNKNDDKGLSEIISSIVSSDDNSLLSSYVSNLKISEDIYSWKVIAKKLMKSIGIE